MSTYKLQRFDAFLNDILLPAGDDFFRKLEDNTLKLHDAFSITFFIAHALDHISECSKRIDLIGKGRNKKVEAFDRLFHVEGGRFQNVKFRIINAINNSFKHVFLNERKEYKDLKQRYGLIDFQVLKEEDGFIFYDSIGYRFDYSRVVLRQVLNILFTEY